MQVAVEQSSVSSEAAVLAVEGALNCAHAMGIQVSVAVVDRGGQLLAFRRTDMAVLGTVDLACDKAFTAVTLNMSTLQWREILEESRVHESGFAYRSRLVALGGGLPIRNDNGLLGGIGVSGASEDVDARCAHAGLTTIGLSSE